MTYYQIALFTIFGIFAAMVVADKNVAEYIVLLTKIVKMQFERMRFMIIYHPKNPITNYIQAQKMNKLALQLQQELQQKDS
jgi:histidinol-phosphate/aromatic aminotransferase/cobyric acid decarboxylase-like protein